MELLRKPTREKCNKLKKVVSEFKFTIRAKSPLQHGAIIAREYGIPCVSGVANAQNIIKDGDLLEVDGSSGIVKIIN